MTEQILSCEGWCTRLLLIFFFFFFVLLLRKSRSFKRIKTCSLISNVSIDETKVEEDDGEYYKNEGVVGRNGTRCRGCSEH